jgi:inhibitor of cysteine peptidase
LTVADSGKSIQVSQGDQVAIRLGENPTTGYGWAVDQINPDVMKPVGSDYEPASDSGIGGGGERIFTFTAVKVGSSPIQLKLWRKWEGDKSIRQRFQVTIEVNG